MARRACKKTFITTSLFAFSICHNASISSSFTLLVDFPLSPVHGGLVKQDIRLLAAASTTTIAAPLPPSINNKNEQPPSTNDDDGHSTRKPRKKSSIQTLEKNTGRRIKYLIHRGRSSAMIKRAPSIAGIGLCRGWDEGATLAFTKAVQRLGKEREETSSEDVYYISLHVWCLLRLGCS
jgi:hypothetical protein